MSKSIEDLRESLFATLQGVRDGTIDLDKAKAINDLGQTIINSARVEVDYLRMAGSGNSAFIEPAKAAQAPALTHDGANGKEHGLAGVTRHLLRG